MSGTVVHVKSADDFKNYLKTKDALVVVDFFATWCGPCKMIAPTIEKIAKEKYVDVVFLKVDVDELEDVAAEYNIQAMPTFLYFKNGVKVGESVGASLEKIEKMIVTYK